MSGTVIAADTLSDIAVVQLEKRHVGVVGRAYAHSDITEREGDYPVAQLGSSRDLRIGNSARSTIADDELIVCFYELSPLAFF